jgi:DNA polymerase III delta prime subunit
VRFNQLPQQKIHEFIKDICLKEGLDLNDKSISVIQNLYKSDIRSMINFIQLNQNIVVKHDNILNATVWERLDCMFQESDAENAFAKDHNKLKEFIHTLSIHYNIDKKQIIKDYYNYKIKNTKTVLTTEILNDMEVILHNYDCQIDALVDYFIMNNMNCDSSNK